MSKKVVLLIGHSSSSPGATSYDGDTEFHFNSFVAREVEKFGFKNGSLYVMPKSNYAHKRIHRLDPDLVIELHFNAFEKPVLGSECLCFYGWNDDRVLIADEFQKEFQKRFGIKSRPIKFLEKGDRGYYNLNAIRQVPSFIFEPCFANFETKDSKKIIKDPTNYIQFLVDYLDFYFGNRDKVTYNIMEKMIGIIRSWYTGEKHEQSRIKSRRF